MNILFITEKFPLPLDTGGKIRTFNILRGLSTQHQVTLITTYESNEQKNLLNELNNYCKKIYLVKANKRFLPFSLIISLTTSLPIMISRHFNSLLANKISSITQSNNSNFDIVHFDHLDSTIYIKNISAKIPFILDEHNVVTNQIKFSYKNEKNILLKYFLKTQITKTQKYENQVCKKMHTCFVCSQTDKEYLKNIVPDSHITVIPNGVDMEFFTQLNNSDINGFKKLQEKKTIIFVGALDYGPGSLGVEYFIKNIFPLLEDKIPDIHFLVIGQNPPNQLKKLENDKITFTGRVEDIRPYVNLSKIFIVPLLSGSGTRLKILSAMAMKIPVVSTSIGAEGLIIKPDENILIADDPKAFADSIINLIENRTQYQKICNNAFNLVNSMYSWNKIWDKLLHSYQDIK